MERSLSSVIAENSGSVLVSERYGEDHSEDEPDEGERLPVIGVWEDHLGTGPMPVSSLFCSTFSTAK